MVAARHLHWYVLSTLSLSATTIHATRILAANPENLHLDLEMDGREYRRLWHELASRKELPPIQKNDPLDEILTLGQRNLLWLDTINANRGEGNKLELSTAETQVGIPIETPRESNRTIITNNFTILKSNLPKEIAAVLLSTGSLPNTAPTDDETFLKYIRDVDKLYQSASRWLLEEPYLSSYSGLSRKDIRGYYFLSKEANLDKTLQNWDNESDTVRLKLSPWLIGICHNSGRSNSQCKTDLTAAINKDKNPKAFYEKYIVGAQSLFHSFFDVQNPRSDAKYSASMPNSFELPFQKPDRSEVQDWLKDNIQDEWKFQSFQLSLNFKSQSPGSAYVTFEPGATPHVDGLGASHITMDANRNIQEYTSRWTIRHEFGHVLGFPDCYVEFYDADREVMINYQIDITNLMCSRRGHLQAQHMTALQKAYWKH